MAVMSKVSEHLELQINTFMPIAIYMNENNLRGKLKIQKPSEDLLMDCEELPVNFMGHEILWV